MLSASVLAIAMCAVPLVMISGYFIMGLLSLIFVGAAMAMTIWGVLMVFEEKSIRNHHIDQLPENVVYLPDRSFYVDKNNESREREARAL